MPLHITSVYIHVTILPSCNPNAFICMWSVVKYSAELLFKLVKQNWQTAEKAHFEIKMSEKIWQVNIYRIVCTFQKKKNHAR